MFSVPMSPDHVKYIVTPDTQVETLTADKGWLGFRVLTVLGQMLMLIKYKHCDGFH
jgi:hypothetical protein